MPNIVPSIGKREVAHIKLMGQMDEQMIKDNSVYPFILSVPCLSQLRPLSLLLSMTLCDQVC
jgi:hypothetical protein